MAHEYKISSGVPTISDGSVLSPSLWSKSGSANVHHDAVSRPLRRVLCVDDSEAIQKVMKLALKDQGYAVQAVSSVVEMTRCLKHNSYDLLICDGQIAGSATQHKLKELKQSLAAETQLIILSGSYDGIDKVAYGQAGFAHVLAKPFSCADVLTQVKSLVPPLVSDGADESRQGASQYDAHPARHRVQSIHSPVHGSDRSEHVNAPTAKDQQPFWPEPYVGAADLWADHGSHATHGTSQHKRDDNLAELSESASYGDSKAVGSVLSSSSAPLPAMRLSAMELDLVAAEVLERIAKSLSQQIHQELAKMVSQNIQKDIRSLIREELESIADRRSTFSISKIK